MKKILLSSLVLLAISCNSGTAENDEDLKSDSVDMIEPEVLKNDIPMRTVDTSKNLMMDTINPRDTMQRP